MLHKMRYCHGASGEGSRFFHRALGLSFENLLVVLVQPHEVDSITGLDFNGVRVDIDVERTLKRCLRVDFWGKLVVDRNRRKLGLCLFLTDKFHNETCWADLETYGAIIHEAWMGSKSPADMTVRIHKLMNELDVLLQWDEIYWHGTTLVN
ncbi:hypothetical protein JRO89_XS04G0142100 [Xanthoceras sorbifolium]|uniref:Uncharacterized protein n=1 Tax=Xanthoceras sorbifolium TaxID=99658 RepID=A0ABQ8I581_9ROSI|nr:hypothetical protein JRO89_XS04G0142100 [Xanthoceras sorbifolium]